MQIAVFGPDRRVGIIDGEKVIDISAAYAVYLAENTDEKFPSQQAGLIVPAELGAFIAAKDGALAGAREALEYLRTREDKVAGLRGELLSRQLADVKLHAPLAQRARLFMAGSNYPAHTAGAEGGSGADEAATERARIRMREIGQRGFISFTENCVDPGAAVVHPARTDMLDFEGEIAVVIGARCKDVHVAEASQFFWGFFLMNDFSARRALPVADNPGSRFARDKNFDSSKSAGPYIAVDEFADAQDIFWETRVNDELRQQGHTRDMIFSFAEMLAHLSEDMTMFPGDVISGGTAAGTVFDTTPPNPDGTRDPSGFLKVGDVVEVSNPVLGTLANQITAKED